MAFVSRNFGNNEKAPIGKWTCAPTSALGPYATSPTGHITKGPDLCGQCVSYVKRVCPELPATSHWKRGALVKDNKGIQAGTVIATFRGPDYSGHAAIYVTQDDRGIKVYDQWCTGNGKPVGARILRWNGSGVSNNGSGFYVVELKT